MGEEPVLILVKNGTSKNITLMLSFPMPMQNPNLQLKSSILILKICHFYLLFHLRHYYPCLYYLYHF